MFHRTVCSQITLILALLVFTGCGGKINDELVGKWKAYNGDIWQFKSDKMFSIEGGRQQSLIGSGKMVPNLPRWGKWDEKEGILTLQYEHPASNTADEYRWEKSGGKLQLTRLGHESPSWILSRTD